MRCSCGRRACYHRRHSGEFLCSPCLKRSVERIFARTVKKFQMVEKGDRIAVGLSGGKDSTVMLHLLKKKLRIEY